MIKFIKKDPVRSSSLSFFGSKSASKSSLPNDSGSECGGQDLDSASETGSVGSHNNYGVNIQQIILEAESPEVSYCNIECRIIFILAFFCCLVAPLLGDDDKQSIVSSTRGNGMTC